MSQRIPDPRRHTRAREIDHHYTDELVCPYCGEKHEDDGEMNEPGEHQCQRCDKHFKYDVDYSKSFTSKQVPCLNGGPHDWRPCPEFADLYSDPKWCLQCEKRSWGERLPRQGEKEGA